MGRFDSHIIVVSLFVSQKVLLNRNAFILYCRLESELLPEFSSPFYLIYEAFHDCLSDFIEFFL
jgi:hypothetical protein